uniref:Uncharacterized protein n=1 Tax=Candidatus Methanogaster sp. ANME-2c ERB4 TaxID=2759911 RepID=A0A7G9Y956_9EURY|nr:hypothetical protein CBGFFKFA_00006 [Methanosarcinales archaeon ANME-2c ERB4]
MVEIPTLMAVQQHQSLAIGDISDSTALVLMME